MDSWVIRSAIKKNETTESILINDKTFENTLTNNKTDSVPISKTIQTLGSNKINQIIQICKKILRLNFI